MISLINIDKCSKCMYICVIYICVCVCLCVLHFVISNVSRVTVHSLSKFIPLHPDSPCRRFAIPAREFLQSYKVVPHSQVALELIWFLSIMSKV